MVPMLLTLCLLVLRLCVPTPGTFGLPGEHAMRTAAGDAPVRTSIERAAHPSPDDAAGRNARRRAAPEQHLALLTSRDARPFSVESRWRPPASGPHSPDAGAAGVPRGADAAMRVALRVRAHHASREAADRETLLAYYPTAPPLRAN